MSPPKGMDLRYQTLKNLYRELNKEKVKEFISKCKLFIKTTNKLIQKESKKKDRKLYRGMLHEIAVYLTKAEKKFFHQRIKSITLVNCESAFNEKISTGVIVNYRHKDLEFFLNDAKEVTLNFLKPKLHNCALKVSVMLTAIFEVKEQQETMYFYTKTLEIFKSSNLKKWYNKQVTQVLLNRLSTLEVGPSNTALSEIVSLSIYTYAFQPIQLARVGTWIPTPRSLKGRRSILNIKNKKDSLCFLHCINAFVNPTKNNPNRLSSYPPIKNLNLNLQGLSFPMNLKNIEKFEKKTNTL